MEPEWEVAVMVGWRGESRCPFCLGVIALLKCRIKQLFAYLLVAPVFKWYQFHQNVLFRLICFFKKIKLYVCVRLGKIIFIFLVVIRAKSKWRIAQKRSPINPEASWSIATEKLNLYTNFAVFPVKCNILNVYKLVPTSTRAYSRLSPCRSLQVLFQRFHILNLPNG